MAACAGHAVLVCRVAVKNSCFVKIGERLTGTGRPLMGQAHLVKGPSLASPVGQRPVDRRRFLRQGKRCLMASGLLADRAEFQ